MRPLPIGLIVTDPLDNLNEAMEINSETLRESGERFRENLRRIQAERAKRQAEDRARFERRMFVRKIVRVGLYATASVLAIKAVQKAQKTEED